MPQFNWYCIGFFRVIFRSDLITVHCFGAPINVVLNQLSFKLINMSVSYIFWFSVVIKQSSLCRYCQYSNQILNDFLTVYYYIQLPRFNILYFHPPLFMVCSEFSKSGTWVMFLENSLQCQSFIMHNPAELNVTVKIIICRT